MAGLLLLLIAASPANAAVEENLNATHLYNETHSPTGGCFTSSADKAKYPACLEELPEGPLTEPTDVAVDAYGNQDVVTRNESKIASRHIDIFDPQGDRFKPGVKFSGCKGKKRKDKAKGRVSR